MSDSFSIIADLRGQLATANEEIIKLRAQTSASSVEPLADTWQPVDDLEEHWTNQYQKPIFVYFYNELLILEDDESEECMSVKVPDGVRLCRKVAKAT